MNVGRRVVFFQKAFIYKATSKTTPGLPHGIHRTKCKS